MEKYSIEFLDKNKIQYSKQFDNLNTFAEFLLSLDRKTNFDIKLFKVCGLTKKKEIYFEWHVLRDYIESNVATHVDLTTHIDTLRAYALKNIYISKSAE